MDNKFESYSEYIARMGEYKRLSRDELDRLIALNRRCLNAMDEADSEEEYRRWRLRNNLFAIDLEPIEKIRPFTAYVLECLESA